MSRLVTITCVLITFASLLSSTVVLVDATEPLTLTIVQGTLTGKIDTDHSDVRTFLGIPYATAPVGALRWKSPLPAPTFSSNPFDATQYRAMCTQLDGPKVVGAEDCLFLNVFTPLTIESNTSLPVYIFIHGGGWIEGSSNAHPGNHLVHANGGMVMVTINYRLGPFGFLAHPALSAETGPGQIASSGNYGFEDQREAMKWVQKNIHAFGGDPTRVTIGGESAGAVATCLHLVSKPSAGLFNQAIIESGGCDNLKSLDNYEQVGQAFVQQLITYLPSDAAANCNSTNPVVVTACLRSDAITAARLYQTAYQQGAFNIFGPTSPEPNVDGKNLLDYPANTWSSNKMNQPMKVLVGTNQAEMAGFVPPIGSQLPAASAQMISKYATALSGFNTTIVNYYTQGVAQGRFPSIYLDYVSLLTKNLMACPVLRVAKLYSASGNQAYTYMYNYTYTFATWNASVAGGAIHGAELVPVFGLTAGGTQLDQIASQQIMRYWINFIQYSGQVNANSNFPFFSPNIASPTWTAFSRNTLNAMVFQYDSTVGMVNNIFQPECDMWDSVGTLMQGEYTPRINPGFSSSSSGPSSSSSSSSSTSASNGSSSSSSTATSYTATSSTGASSSTATSSTVASSTATSSTAASSSSTATDSSPSSSATSPSTSSSSTANFSSSSSSTGGQITESSSSTGDVINSTMSTHYSSSSFFVHSFFVLFASALMLSKY